MPQVIEDLRHDRLQRIYKGDRLAEHHADPHPALGLDQAPELRDDVGAVFPRLPV